MNKEVKKCKCGKLVKIKIKKCECGYDFKKENWNKTLQQIFVLKTHLYDPQKYD